MNTKALYNQWSATYDVVENKTRDLEKEAGQQVLSHIAFENVLEIGCGTGKNTEWLCQKAKHLQAVDLSEEMMKKAEAKVSERQVHFTVADITKPWDFVEQAPDLITCSLVLEHISNLGFIFQEAQKVLQHKGYFYLCELHPYKQYCGSKARFETTEGLQVLECFVHHVSDYYEAAIKNGFVCRDLTEWFDDNDRSNPPRLLSFLFQKTSA
jgi:ubiquinone/menaquinone biosynthesis C-methylase UbiE